MKKSIFEISSFVLLSFLIACAPDKSQTAQQKDYIINPPDFEELERKKAERMQGRRPPKKEKKPTLSKEDSTKAYIKELTHHFHLQEKQMKALEYIYSKYDKKEAQAQTQNDTTKLNKLLAEKEQSIKVVLGERYYARKGRFDEKIIKEKLKEENKIKFGFLKIPSKETKPISRASNQYIEALRKELKLSQRQVAKLRSLIRQYDHKKDLLDSIQMNQLAENKM